MTHRKRVRRTLVTTVVATGLLVAGPAVADVLSAFGYGHSRAAACQSAKRNGEAQVRALSQASVRGSRDPYRTYSVVYFGRCECSRDRQDDWECTVDVFYEPD